MSKPASWLAKRPTAPASSSTRHARSFTRRAGRISQRPLDAQRAARAIRSIATASRLPSRINASGRRILVFVFVRRGPLGHTRGEYFVDAVLIHVDDLESPALPLGHIGGMRHTSQQQHHHAAQSVVAPKFFFRRRGKSKTIFQFG